MAQGLSESKIEVKVVRDATEEVIDLSSYGGSSPEEKCKDAIERNGVLIVGKAWCPFCIEVVRTLSRQGVNFRLINVDTIPEGPAVHAYLKETYKQVTVPYVFIGGELLGGCSDTKQAMADGTLDVKLRAAGCAPTRTARAVKLQNLAVLEGKPLIPLSLFSFPEAVDNRAIRLNSFWVFIVSLLVCIYYKRIQAHWVMVGLLVDFCLKFLGGGNLSPMGGLTQIFIQIFDLFGSRPQFAPSPPKQFAVLCGVVFSGLSAFFFLVSVHKPYELQIVGLSFAALLALAAALEAFVAFCLGCWFFGLMVQVGLMPKNIYQLFTTIKPELEYTWTEMNKHITQDWPEPERLVKHLIGKDTPLQVDYKYKNKTDDHTREDFHLIKHVKMLHNMCIMGLAGCACAWKVASSPFILNTPQTVNNAIGLLSVTVFFIWFVLYAAKMAMYPQKIVKEWQHPVKGQTFVVPFVNLILFAYLIMEQDLTLAKVIFWIGATCGMAMSIYRVGEWLSIKREMEHVNPAWIIMPVSNFVTALVGPMLDDRYRDFCQFWFGFAFVSWMVLFALTFLKAVIYKPEEDRMRPLLGVWIAAPAVMGVAYLECFLPNYKSYMQAVNAPYLGLPVPPPYDTIPIQPFNDFIFINLNWFSVALTLVMLEGFIKPFFCRLKFCMVYWAAGFPSAALAFVTLVYHGLKPGGLSQGICIAALAAASSVNCTLGLHTVALFLGRHGFVPDYKWGPLSFMRLTHEAFRAALPRLVVLAKQLADAGPNAESLLKEELQESWRLLSLAHDAHAKHEDLGIFKVYNDYFPLLTQKYTEDHEHHHEAIARIDAAVAAACKAGAGAGPAAAALVPLLEEYARDMEQHMRGEEDHLQAMPRKWLPLEVQKQIVRKCWEITPASVWAEYLPWTVKTLPMLWQRTRFIKSLMWAMPERAQHFGIMLACELDEVQYRRIMFELPELIPRGARGWERYW